MRRYKKNQALHGMELMEKAHDQILTDVKRRRTDEAVDLIVQCQQNAVEIGTAIEASEGEGTEAVHLLEDYCEEAYQCYMQLAENHTSALSQTMKRLNKLLRRASSELQNNISTQLEIVFLPYKASMWDSFETVWEQASLQANAVARVIPIPYFERNPDGSFGERHYEGGELPPYVPITEYDGYDFEAMHPDQIYIHNPYDDKNLVTSVHPFFYSANLKQYTDELVYIPYFVLGDIDPSDRAAVDSVAHLCTTPAAVYADRIIVESEDVRRVYIEALTELGGQQTKKIWENKIVGTGSPKYDRVKHPRPEDMIVPDEWKGALYRTDGSRKKLLLYNTSISAFLAHSEEMLSKIEENIALFKEQEQDIALLWRPHPLIVTTISSLRPELEDRYRMIVGTYQSEGWGIYDDTPRLHRAIALSDAYYGDWSSLVWLYKQTRKPIMIQNCMIQGSKE